MWEDRLLPSIHVLRKRCDELINQAYQEQDMRKLCQVALVKGYLYNEDCLQRYNWHRLRPSRFLPTLGYDWDEVRALEKEIEDRSLYKAKLQYTDKKGTVHTAEAMVDPQIEEYYAFEHFGFFKIRYTREFYSLNPDGTWEWDPKAERRYYDNSCDHTHASIVRS